MEFKTIEFGEAIIYASYPFGNFPGATIDVAIHSSSLCLSQSHVFFLAASGRLFLGHWDLHLLEHYPLYGRFHHRESPLQDGSDVPGILWVGDSTVDLL